MKNIWKFADIIDLEYFSNIDQFLEDTQTEDLHQRERHIFLEAQQHGKLTTGSHAQYLAVWLASMRTQYSKKSEGSMPGIRLGDALHLFKWLLLLCGAMFGLVVGFTYFVYTGTTPLNVFIFFTVFILPQLGMIALVFLRTSIAKLTRKTHFFVGRVLVPLFHRFANVLKQRTFSDLPDEQQQSFNLLFSGKNSRIFTFPLFVQAQLFGITFNVALLLVTFFKIATVDLAFGWQTTLQLGAERLNTLVQLIAVPWSWILPVEISYPTLAQIEGSRIILKDGIYHLATENLTSWWPFLLLSLLCYGLLPRLFLLLFGLLAERRNCRSFLNQRKFRAITTRMRTPLVTSQADAERPSGESPDSQVKHTGVSAAKKKREIEKSVVLVPDELFNVLSAEELEHLLLPQHFQVANRTPVFKSYEDDQRLLNRVEKEQKAVVVIVEAWMPPIQEHLLFLEKLSQRLGGNMSLAFCLLGKPHAGGTFNRLSRESLHLWKEKIFLYCDTAMVFEPGVSVESTEEQH